MHIADGILSTEIVVAADVASFGIIYFLGRKVKVPDVPKMGLMAAALFVVSLIHFPIAGTSVHFGLFGLAGILLGIQSFPVVFAAILFQSFIFQHGGILSVGINSINMGAGAIAAGMFWKLSEIPESVRAFTAGFIGIMLPAFLMSVEFQLSGYGKGIFYILYIYLITASAEGMITLFIVKFFRKVNSPILRRKNK